MSPEQELEQAMLEVCARAAAENQIALVTLKSGTRSGARQFASRQLERHGNTSPGYRHLVQAGRFDLTLESLVLQARFRSLFSHGERIEARARLIDSITGALNAAAHGRVIGRLQDLRAERVGLQAAPDLLFGGRSVRRNDGYAYHAGGRDELHFHIAMVGFDREPWIRYGVGLALSPSKTSGLERFLPKIDRFNEFLQADPDRFARLRVQHHRFGEVTTFDPGPLPSHFVCPHAFVFLGVHVPLEELAVERVLDEYDALMPLHHYVETGTELSVPAPPAAGRAPTVDAPAQRQAPRDRHTVDRALRHRMLRSALVEHLDSLQSGSAGGVVDAHARNGVTADVTVCHQGVYTYYGISTELTAHACLRETLGRLLNGLYQSESPEPEALVVVGEAEPDATTQDYVEFLRARFGLTLRYQRLDLATNRLH
ncbi:MAG: hypothetical protein RIC56_22840 [Pseudomonadales bacterium]